MKIICVGRNYAEHAKELNNAVPEEPVLFMKCENALLPPGEPAIYPEFTKKLQYECEVVVRISRDGKGISAGEAPDYYKEITLGIDFTARDIQERQKEKRLPWEIAKSFDGSAAVGDFIAIDANIDVAGLAFELSKNGTTVQLGNTADMLFSINAIIAHASKYFTLNAGDLIFTGTPAGVGDLAPGDRLRGVLSGHNLLDISLQ